MTLLEKIWILVSVSIVFIILSTDPKSSTNNVLGNQLSPAFASMSDEQKFIKRLNRVLITAFFLITLSLSYFT